MIGTDEMSSTGMDISESFRPEDISKADFFDFVTAPDMGIGLGVNVNLHHSHHNHQQQQHQQQHHQHHTHLPHTQQQQQQQSPHAMTQQHHHTNTHTHHGSQHQHQHSATTDRTMTHDGGGNGSGGGGNSSGGNASIRTNGDSHNDASGLSDGSSASTTDPTLQGYEFWSTDKEHTSTIFEDLDRYCWQQQSATTASTNNSSTTAMHHATPANTLNPLHSANVNPTSPHNHHSPATPVTTPSSLNSTPVPQTQLNSDGTISNIISTDGQIYTLTVLNGNEPWLKRDADAAAAAHLSNTLDLDSLLGFPGYIKSEYPYDDSGFSTDGCKDVSGDTTNVLTQNSSSSSGLVNNQRLPSLINTMSVSSTAGGVGGGGSGSGGVGGSMSNPTDSVATALSISQQLDQFHNNNNDWHMTDHNNEQNSAESLLRSALQGKGYAKGLHMHNGITLMPSSPTVKDDDMRRILFPVDTDGLNFSDTSLSAAQIFDDTQAANGHNSHLVVPHSPVTNGPLTPVTNNPNTNNTNNNNNSNQSNSLLVDDMFLSLENAFSDDFEKIKQFCTAGGSSATDYSTNDVMMQISPNGSGATQTTNTASMQAITTTTHQQLCASMHTTAISTTTPNNACRQATPIGGLTTATISTQQQQQHHQAPPQPLKPEVTTSTQRIVSTSKVTKKYKRTLSTIHHQHNNNINHNNNNNNPNVINHNTNSSNSKSTTTIMCTLANGQNRNGPNSNASSGSSTNSSSSPTHCNGLIGTTGNNNNNNSSSTNTSSTTSITSPSLSTSSSSTTSGQRKERSLHYCSICSKGFKDKYSVNVHIRTHTGEKPFACTLCGKSFRQKAHLAKHYQTHMAQKNNGSLVKGNTGKHHRSSNAQTLNTATLTAGHSHPRSLSIASAPNTPSALSSVGGGGGGGGNSIVGGLVSGILSSSGLPPLGVAVSASSAPTTPTTLLPPANGLLANR